MVPSFVIILSHLNPTQSLVISQVVLSFSLPLTLIPLVMFTGRNDLMGNLANRPATKAIAILIVAVVIALNHHRLKSVGSVPVG